MIKLFNKIGFKFCKIEYLLSFLFGIMSFKFIYRTNIFFNNSKVFFDEDYLVYRISYFTFINSEWNFPIFITNNLFTDESFNLVLIDYIPIYKLFIKVTAFITGFEVLNPFIYFILLSQMLMFYYSYKLLDISTSFNSLGCILGAAIFSTLPLVPTTYSYHSGVGAHWLIVASLYYYFRIRNGSGLTSQLAITCLSIFINPYLFFMILGIFLISIFHIKLNMKYLIKNALIATTVGIVYFTLYFGNLEQLKYLFNQEFKFEFTRKLSAEFNSFFCSQKPVQLINKYFYCYEPYTNQDIESYAYLGYGVIVFLVLFILKYKTFYKFFLENLAIFSLSLIYLLFSFGNRVMIGHKQIFEYDFNKVHETLILMFRAHGRFTYLFYYLTVASLIYLISNITNKKQINLMFLTILLILQLVDMNNIYKDTKYNPFISEFNNDEIVLAALKASTVHKDDRLYILPPDNCYEDFDLYLFAAIFVEHGGSINATRYRGGINREECTNFSILDNIKKNTPAHFLLNSINYENNKNYFSNEYSCISIGGYFYEKEFKYCEEK